MTNLCPWLHSRPVGGGVTSLRIYKRLFFVALRFSDLCRRARSWTPVKWLLQCKCRRWLRFVFTNPLFWMFMTRFKRRKASSGQFFPFPVVFLSEVRADCDVLTWPACWKSWYFLNFLLNNGIMDINGIEFVFQTARWSALLVGILYGKRRYGKKLQVDLKHSDWFSNDILWTW